MTDDVGTVERFSGLAERYDRYRPDYPLGAIEALLAGFPAPATVADIGAGTGISTRALARAGATAIAIEPNDEMRAFAVAKGVDARAGSAERTGLAAGSIDVVAAFQAFHWFANDVALAEFARILRPGGRLAIVWNERDDATEFSRAYRELEREHSRRDMLAGADFSDASLEPLLLAAGFVDVRLARFENAQRFDLEGAIGRMRSASYAPKAGPALDALLAGLETLFARCVEADGRVELRYQTEVWTARLHPH